MLYSNSRLQIYLSKAIHPQEPWLTPRIHGRGSKGACEHWFLFRAAGRGQSLWSTEIDPSIHGTGAWGEQPWPSAAAGKTHDTDPWENPAVCSCSWAPHGTAEQDHRLPVKPSEKLNLDFGAYAWKNVSSCAEITTWSTVRSSQNCSNWCKTPHIPQRGESHSMCCIVWQLLNSPS